MSDVDHKEQDAPRRLAEDEPASTRLRPVAVVVSGAVLAALIPAAAYLMVSRSTAAPTTSAPVSADATQDPVLGGAPSLAGTGTSPSLAAAETNVSRHLDACLTKAAAGDRLVNETRATLDRFSEHRKAAEDFENETIGLGEARTTLRRTLNQGREAMARYRSEERAFNALPFCDPVTSAPPEITARIDSCLNRTAALRKVMDQSRRPLDDWQLHLDQDEAHDTSGWAYLEWETGWTSAKYGLRSWSDADKEYAKAAPCR